jgi:hypothetical protein
MMSFQDHSRLGSLQNRLDTQIQAHLSSNGGKWGCSDSFRQLRERNAANSIKPNCSKKVIKAHDGYVIELLGSGRCGRWDQSSIRRERDDIL